MTVTETAAADGARADGTAPAADGEESGDGKDGADGGSDEDGVYALDDTAVYEPTEVALSGLKRAVTGEYAAPENTAYLKFTVKVKNGGEKALDVTQLTVNCSYGKDGKSSESVFDSDAGLEGGPETKLLPGRSLNVPWGCELPKGRSSSRSRSAPTSNPTRRSSPEPSRREPGGDAARGRHPAGPADQVGHGGGGA
ncbi:hypothetical protein ACFQ3Z_36880 [Streptomyces nogalater]